MKLKKLLASILLALVFIVPISSFATDWRWVASTDQASYYVDIDSVKNYDTGGFDVNTKVQYLNGSYDINRIEISTHKKGYDLAWVYELRQSFDVNNNQIFYSNDARMFPPPWKPIYEGTLEYKYYIVVQNNQ